MEEKQFAGILVSLTHTLLKAETQRHTERSYMEAATSLSSLVGCSCWTTSWVTLCLPFPPLLLSYFVCFFVYFFVFRKEGSQFSLSSFNPHLLNLETLFIFSSDLKLAPNYQINTWILFNLWNRKHLAILHWLISLQCLQFPSEWPLCWCLSAVITCCSPRQHWATHHPLNTVPKSPQSLS